MSHSLAPTVIRASLEETFDSFATLLADADETADVATCPGWTIRDLAIHLGMVHRWAAGILLSGAIHRRPRPVIERPLSEWYRGMANVLLAAIDATTPSEPIPNFTNTNEVAAFWPRRQLHEATIHLRDLTLAMKIPDIPVTPELAADGVDELIAVSFRVLIAKETPPVVSQNIRIHATDTGDEWILSAATPGELADPGSGWQASIAGTSSDLYFGLWGRVSRESLSVEGDAAADLLAGPTSV